MVLIGAPARVKLAGEMVHRGWALCAASDTECIEQFPGSQTYIHLISNKRVRAINSNMMLLQGSRCRMLMLSRRIAVQPQCVCAPAVQLRILLWTSTVSPLVPTGFFTFHFLPCKFDSRPCSTSSFQDVCTHMPKQHSTPGSSSSYMAGARWKPQ